MSTMKIEERINVSAPPARVWKFLLDPARVAGCLPGAKLDGTEGDNTFLGTMKVKVGPVMMEFKGKATLSEIVEAEHRVTMTGTGNDKSGGGSAKMDMKSHIVALDGGGSEIVVVADVDLAGKLVRFGRGMMEGISKQLFKQFSERVRAELANEEEESDGEEEEAPAKDEAARAGAAEAKAAEAAPAETEEPKKEESVAEKVEEAAKAESPQAEAAAEAPEEEAPKKDEPAAGEAVTKDEAAAPDTVSAKEESAAPEEAKEVEETKKADEPAAQESSPAAEEKKEPPPEETKKPAAKKTAKKKAAALAVKKEEEALDAGSLVWAAIWEWIKSFFRRLFGKRD
ncbi:MAG: SRPBCC family protein [Minicystis sp.]